jgi:hypothetical protein
VGSELVGTVFGSVLVGTVVGSELVGTVVGSVLVGSVVGGVLVGGVVGGVTLPFSILKSARLLDFAPSDRVSTALSRCDPSASFVVSYGLAVPSAVVPAKSKGGVVSTRVGGRCCHRSSR